MNIIKPPSTVTFDDKKTLFLAGSIDNGSAEDWQAVVIKSFLDTEVSILNPRRDEWDASWEQSINNPIFKEQVSWELNGLDQADVVLFNFLKNSKAPISLMELGICSNRSNIVVCCEEGFWRQGNIEVVCDTFKIPLVNDIQRAIELVQEKLV